MPQPVAFNTGSAISGSIQTSKISYAVDGDNKDYRGGYAGKTWYSELPATNGVVFAKDTTSIGRGISGSMAFWTSATTSSADILFTANRLPGSPGNFATTQSAYSWSLANGWFLNHPNEPFNNFDTDGLILCLDAAKIVSYPETASIWYDMSGNNNSGSLTNGPTFNSNGAIVLDGINDYVSQNYYTATNFVNNQSWTIDVLINVLSSQSAANTTGGVLTNQRYQSEQDPGGFGLNIINKNYCVNLTSGSTGNAITNEQLAQTPINYTKNERITALFNSASSTVSIYRNGVLANTTTNANYKWSTRSSGVLQSIGTSTQGGWGYFFPMKLYNVSLYNRALTQAEISQNYYQAPIVTSGLVFAVDAGNLVSYESGSTTTYSLTGSISGSLVNGTGYSNINGGVWSFDGTDDRLTFGSPNITSSCTVNQWIQPLSGSATTMRTVEHVAVNTATAVLYSQLIKISNMWYHQVLVSGYQSGYAEEMNVYFQSNVTSFVQNNTPYNFNFTWERTSGVNSTLKTYLNGVFREQQINTNNYWANTASLATSTYTVGSSYKGNIGTTSFYNRALTETEITQNFNAQKGKFGL